MLSLSARLEYMRLHTRPAVSNARECNADMSTNGFTPTRLTLDFRTSSHDDPGNTTQIQLLRVHISHRYIISLCLDLVFSLTY